MTQKKERRQFSMIRIAISQSAFEAIARSLPLGSVAFENVTTEQGERLLWLEPRVVARSEDDGSCPIPPTVVTA
jgi:hypothetical protein